MKNPRKRYPKSYRLFLDQAIDATDYEEDYIAQLLGSRFGAFDPKELPQYLNYIVGVKEAEDGKTDLAKEVAKRLVIIPCPICGADTINKHGRAGRYTKTPEWQCVKGGLTHFLWDKANHIVTLRNQREDDPSKHKPLPFPPEVPIENDTGTEGDGVEEPDTGGSSEDPGVDARVDEPEGEQPDGVQGYTPVRLSTSGSN